MPALKAQSSAGVGGGGPCSPGKSLKNGAVSCNLVNFLVIFSSHFRPSFCLCHLASTKH